MPVRENEFGNGPNCPLCDYKCIKELIIGGRVNTLSFIEKKDIIPSQKPTSDLCISQTSKD